MDVRRIMVPLDGSSMAEAALPVAESLARPETSFFLVRAAEAPDGLADVMAARRDTVEAAKKYLETVATALSARGFAKVETVPLYGPAAAAILEAARVREPDLIVMATSGRSGVRRVVFGSVAEAVVRGTPTPVFLVRAGDGSGRSAHTRAVSRESERAHV
jgi:nucleotide-binding universal stress UspA family protein